MQHPIRLWHVALVGSVAVTTVLSLGGVGLAGPGGMHGAGARQQARNSYLKNHDAAENPTHSGDDGDLADQLDQYDFQRTAPGVVVSGQALVAAAQQAAAMPPSGAAGSSSPPRPTTPSQATTPTRSGRTSAPASPSSAAGSRRWRPRRTAPGSRARPTAACGARATRARTGPRSSTTCRRCPSAPSRSIRSTARCGWAPARPTSRRTPTRATACTVDQRRQYLERWATRQAQPAGVAHDLPHRLRPAAVTRTRRPTTACSARGRPATVVRGPRPGRPDRLPALRPAGDRRRRRPGHGRQDVIAAIGWHGPGNTAVQRLLRVDQLRAVVQRGHADRRHRRQRHRPHHLRLLRGRQQAVRDRAVARHAGGRSDESVLQGIFVRRRAARPAWPARGPRSATRPRSPPPVRPCAVGSGYGVGVQAWYNQDLAVDPSNPDHVYMGLEEVFESTNGGRPGWRPARTGTTLRVRRSTTRARTPRTPTSTP